MAFPYILDWLEWCFFGYVASLCVWTLWKRSKLRQRKDWTNFVESTKEFQRRRISGRGRSWAYIFAVLMMCLLVWGATISRPETQDNIAVVSVQNPYRFTFQHVDDKGNLYGEAFTEDICRNYESPSGDFVRGIIIRKLIYGVQSGCWSLNPNLHEGYFLRWDDNKNPSYAKGLR